MELSAMLQFLHACLAGSTMTSRFQRLGLSPGIQNCLAASLDASALIMAFRGLQAELPLAVRAQSSFELSTGGLAENGSGELALSLEPLPALLTMSGARAATVAIEPAQVKTGRLNMFHVVLKLLIVVSSSCLVPSTGFFW